MEPDLPIEFFLSGVPASAQGSTAGKNAWKLRVEQAAEAVIPQNMWLLEQPLGIEVLLFLNEDLQGDLDNVVKPIQDALTGVIYRDDHQIFDVHAAKYLPDRILKMENPSRKLSEALEEERPLVYIRIHEDS